MDSFEDFLVDQDRQFQNSPNFRIDSFRFFWTYIHPIVLLGFMFALPSFGGGLFFNRGGGGYLPARE